MSLGYTLLIFVDSCTRAFSNLEMRLLQDLQIFGIECRYHLQQQLLEDLEDMNLGKNVFEPVQNTQLMQI